MYETAIGDDESTTGNTPKRYTGTVMDTVKETPLKTGKEALKDDDPDYDWFRDQRKMLIKSEELPGPVEAWVDRDRGTVVKGTEIQFSLEDQKDPKKAEEGKTWFEGDPGWRPIMT